MGKRKRGARPQELGDIDQGTLAGRLAAIRAWADLKQAEIAQRLGVSTAYFSDVERGTAGANVTMCSGVAENFPQINLKWLLCGEGEMLNPYPIDTTAFNKVVEFVFWRSKLVQSKEKPPIGGVHLPSYYTALLYSRASLKETANLERNLLEGAKILRALFSMFDLLTQRRELLRDDIAPAERKSRRVLASPLEKKFGDLADRLEGHTISPGSQLEQAFIEDRLEDILGRRLNDL